MEYYLVCTHDVRLGLSTLPQWNIDLGRKYTTRTDKGVEVSIKDPFVIKFYNISQMLCYKVGTLGPISIYTADIPENKVLFYKEDNMFEYDIDHMELEASASKFLARIISESNIDS